MPDRKPETFVLFLLLFSFAISAAAQEVVVQVDEKDPRAEGKRKYRRETTLRGDKKIHELFYGDKDKDGQFDLWTETFFIEGKRIINIMSNPKGKPPGRMIKGVDGVDVIESDDAADGLHRLAIVTEDRKQCELFVLQKDGHYKTASAKEREELMDGLSMAREFTDILKEAADGKKTVDDAMDVVKKHLRKKQEEESK